MATEQAFFSRPDSFMTVRYLTIRGTNFQIGQQLGVLARERYGKTPEHFRGDPVFARARRVYFQHNYPIQWERVRGMAAAFGLDPSDDGYDLTGLTYLMDVPMPPSGCSAAYYPPTTTASGGGYLSRNYDFSIGSLADMMRMPLPSAIKDTLAPVMSEPYIMAWYPKDGGYASIASHAFDLLSGTIDGMNSAGMVVSILADMDAQNELGPHLEMHPASQQAVGLHELQVMRLLLDTCATAEEARVALLIIKQYYRFTPNHYIVADRAGHSFIYENSTGRNVQHVLDGGGRPQVITNHQLCKQGQPGPWERSRSKTTPSGATRRCRTASPRTRGCSPRTRSRPTMLASTSSTSSPPCLLTPRRRAGRLASRCGPSGTASTTSRRARSNSASTWVKT
ncbi:MAG: hypothetical protein A3H97_13270 [Acidobacteria bacterium RIFCSPLOWO2_02_FULL_65_29]|nr:MAG: hypothetical protein A3H97_13270 [Acidobacteria bacterium RIFCSPLOWO2_02_FULL_65_29]